MGIYIMKNNYLMWAVLATSGFSLIGCNDEITVVESINPESTEFYTAPSFLSANAVDYNNVRAQVNGDGSYTFKLAPELITYPVTFSSLIPEGYKKPVSVTLSTHQGVVATAVTSLISRFPAKEQDAVLTRLSELTGIQVDRLVDNFELRNDVETAEVSRVLYYIDLFDLEDRFDEFLIDGVDYRSTTREKSGSDFLTLFNEFAENEITRSENAKLATNYFYSRYLKNILKTLSNLSQDVDLNSFYTEMEQYRNKELNGVFGSDGVGIFSNTVNSSSEYSYSDTFEGVSNYIEAYVSDSQAISYTDQQLLTYFTLSERNRSLLEGNEKSVYVDLFNEVLNLNADLRKSNFYTPDQILGAVDNLRQFFLDGTPYNKSDFVNDVKSLFGIQLSSTAIELIKYKIDNGEVTAHGWGISDYVSFIDIHSEDEAPSNYTLNVKLLDGTALTEFNPVKDTGAKAGLVIAEVSAEALNGLILGEKSWKLLITGEDASLFTYEWDEQKKHYKIKLASNLSQSSTPTVTLSYKGVWNKYDNEETLSDSHDLTISEDKAFFGLERAAFRPANPSIVNDMGNQLYVYFNKPIDESSIASAVVTLSDSNIMLGEVARSDSEENVLVINIDTSDVQIQSIERDKGTKYAYLHGDSTGKDENDLFRSDIFDDSLYNPDDVLTVQISGNLHGINQDGSTATVDSSITLPVSSIVYRGISYELTRSPLTGRLFMAQNLGATSKCDSQSVSLDTVLPTCRGHYFQYGRVYDGHEIFNHPTLPSSDVTTRTSAISFSDKGWNPETANFLSVTTGNQWVDVADRYFWADSPLKDTSTGTYCPVGYRVPSIVEYDTEFAFIATSMVGKYINNFSESFFYMGFAGNRDRYGNLGTENFYTLMTYGTVSGNNFRTGTFGILNNLTGYRGYFWDHFNGQRTLRGLNMRCMKEYK